MKHFTAVILAAVLSLFVASSAYGEVVHHDVADCVELITYASNVAMDASAGHELSRSLEKISNHKFVTPKESTLVATWFAHTYHTLYSPEQPATSEDYLWLATRGFESCVAADGRAEIPDGFVVPPELPSGSTPI